MEATALTPPRPKKRAGGGDGGRRRAALRRYYKLCDSDGSGEIDIDEFKVALFACDPDNGNAIGFSPNSLLTPLDSFEMFDEARDRAVVFFSWWWSTPRGGRAHAHTRKRVTLVVVIVLTLTLMDGGGVVVFPSGPAR
jgi:hypothetical protein